jgi:hypothetical protein
MEHVLTSLAKCLDFMAQHNLKQHATILEREEFMHSMLVDMVVVVLGEDTVAEAVVLVEVEVALVVVETKIKIKTLQLSMVSTFWTPTAVSAPRNGIDLDQKVETKLLQLVTVRITTDMVIREDEANTAPSRILLEVGDVETLDDMSALSKWMITKMIPPKTPNNNVTMTSVMEMEIAVVEMDVDSVAVHMADANDYSDIPFHVCHLYF